MTKGNVWLKSGKVNIEILDPIYNVNDFSVDELTEKIYEIINQKLENY